ncbi:flagellar biosynthetic protein FliR [Marinococcus luteus]|uniref:flagellar biosynthetic protein FliR n=1 Tax=Marinococcus luteus TaxID=1122204 RepID=UPI002ACD09A2|nr:flagellar biosynthetic protein FliR [Marinococcus luteus]MDZ5781824.1 flagellar biosynthetic protein FliR [Marinococcus luteus]
MEAIIEQLPAFSLVLVRVLAFFTTMPLFSYRTIPNQFKVGLAFFLALAIFPALDAPLMTVDGEYILLLLKEVMLGLAIGLIATIMLYAVQTAGMFLDISFGFLVANVVDPQTGAQSPLFGGYFYAFALLMLLTVNGHHLLLDGIYYSYSFVPIDQTGLAFGDEAVVTHVAEAFNQMFILAFQLAFPLVGSLFLVDLALGIMARAVPQMNVFVVGLPLKIAAGLPLLVVAIPGMFLAIQYLYEDMFHVSRGLLELLGEGQE